MGRPSKYTEAVAAEIVARLTKGEPMASICRDENMPGVTTVWEWQQSRPELSESIARARELGFDAIATDCLAIADDTEGDPQRDRLRVDTRLKLLSKWDPKRYGDKLALGQAEGLGALTVVINKPG